MLNVSINCSQTNFLYTETEYVLSLIIECYKLKFFIYIDQKYLLEEAIAILDLALNLAKSIIS